MTERTKRGKLHVINVTRQDITHMNVIKKRLSKCPIKCSDFLVLKKTNMRAVQTKKTMITLKAIIMTIYM